MQYYGDLCPSIAHDVASLCRRSRGHLDVPDSAVPVADGEAHVQSV